MRDKDLWSALGSLVLTASAVEIALGTILIWLTGHPQPDRVMPLVGGMDVKVKLRNINVYCAKQFPRDKKEISKLCRAVQDAFDDRHLVIHSLLGPSDDPRILLIQPLKFDSNGELPAPILYSPKDILAVSKKLHAAFKALEKKFNTLA